MGERVGDVVERRAGEPLAGQHVRDPGRVGGQRLGGDPALGLRRRRPPPAGRGTPRAGSSPVGPHGGGSANGGIAARRPPRRAARRRLERRRPAARRSRARSRRSRRRRRRRSRRRARARCRRCFAHEPGDPVAGGAGAADVDDEPQRIPGEDAGAPRRSARRARRGRGSRGSARAARPASDRLGEQLLAGDRVLAPGGVERGGQQRVRARRLDQGHRAVDDPRRRSRSPRRRGAGSPTGSCCRRSCGPRRGRRRRRRRARSPAVVGEGEVRAPGLVDDQRHLARVGDLGERGDVGDGAEVGGRDDQRGDRVGLARRAPRRARRGSRQWATPSSGSSSGATNLGRSPERTRPSMTDEWTLRWTTTRSPRCASARQIAWLPPEAPLTRNQLRRAPQASAASRCACWNGCRAGSGPMSMPSMPAGKSSRRSRLADRLAQPRVGAGAALVAGDVEAAGIAIRVGDQRVEVRRLALIHAVTVVPAGRLDLPPAPEPRPLLALRRRPVIDDDLPRSTRPPPRWPAPVPCTPTAPSRGPNGLTR